MNKQCCVSCGDEMFAVGPVCCSACIETGTCPICGEEHPPTRCPDVVKVRREMEAAEMAAARLRVRRTVDMRVEFAPF